MFSIGIRCNRRPALAFFISSNAQAMGLRKHNVANDYQAVNVEVGWLPSWARDLVAGISPDKLHLGRPRQTIFHSMHCGNGFCECHTRRKRHRRFSLPDPGIGCRFDSCAVHFSLLSLRISFVAVRFFNTISSLQISSRDRLERDSCWTFLCQTFLKVVHSFKHE